MKITTRPYSPDYDFLRVRDFLKETLFAFDKPVNWGLERWNWARYHPSVFVEGNQPKTAERMAYWDGAVRLWEDGAGSIVGVVNVESPEPDGEFFLQRRPGADALLDEMLDYAERLDKPEGAARKIYAYDHDAPLLSALARRGYGTDGNSWSCWAEYPFTDIPRHRLPQGFSFASMAEGLDPEARCKVQGLGFNHPDPAEWMTPWEYGEVRKAPDYRPDLDLVTVAPDGEYASCCIAWHDDYNRVAFFEPVCTRPGYRRRGLGREVMMEGARRAARLGATRAFVGSRQEFYRSIGFEMNLTCRPWTKADR